MILLLGGTSETAPLAQQIAEAGFRVLVSTATDVPLDRGEHPGIRFRTGALDEDAIVTLITEHGIRAVVDASHPYAAMIRMNARRAAGRVGIAYLTWVRPACIEEHANVLVAENHEEAASLAFGYKRPVLLTTGSRNLAPYVSEARQTGIALVVRVLPHDTSVLACREAGVSDDCVITGRGPFSVEENLEIIRRFSIGVIVTKDSGAAGGVPAKLEAAGRSGCKVVVVRRPLETASPVYRHFSELLQAIIAASKAG